MQTVPVDDLVFVFSEGGTSEIAAELTDQLRGVGRGKELVYVGYNYQGPELDPKQLVPRGTHGVMLVLRDAPLPP